MILEEFGRSTTVALLLVLTATDCTVRPGVSDMQGTMDTSAMCVDYHRQPTTEALSWEDVTVGVTTLEYIFLHFGEPINSFEWESQARVTIGCEYAYSNSDEFIIFFVVNGKVVGIEIFPDVMWSGRPATLVEAVQDYGRPNFVGWSRLGSYRRVIAWPSEGILTTVLSSNDGNHRISEILFFPKMSYEEFEDSIWSEWIIDATDNMPSYMLDPWPRDPFDWEALESSD